MPRVAYEKRQYSRSTGALEAGTDVKSMLASYGPQLKNMYGDIAARTGNYHRSN